MEFEWDVPKNQTNIIKHGISFQEAQEVFKDPKLLTYIDDRFNYEEIRRKLSIGQLLLPQLAIIVVLVVHTDRNGVIRIISARRANKKERRTYEQQSV